MLCANYMTLIPEVINDRQIIYIDIKEDLSELFGLDLRDWALFVIGDEADNNLLLPFANLCIEKNVLYMAATGKAASRIDDLFDQVMVTRAIQGDKLPTWYVSEDDVLLTSWHKDYKEGFYFITSVAAYEGRQIDKVLVANLTKEDFLPRIRKLSSDIKGGWIPPD